MGPIGVFDSGYGGLTVLREIVAALPRYDYLYLGDNARTPYGNRSFEAVYAYTFQAVRWLFAQGCNLIVLACNTSSAKALRTIQQKDLPRIDPARRVLGVIRPTVELVDALSQTKHVGILGTAGTVASGSYVIEINKLFPGIAVSQEACPMWVPLIENGETDNPGAEYFVKTHVDRLLAGDPAIDTIILGCTHYSLLMNALRRFVPPGVKVVAQDPIVAASLADYLRRHPEMEARCSIGGSVRFFTTDSPDFFDAKGSVFFGGEIRSARAVVEAE